MGAYAGATADASAMIGGLAIPTRPVRALVYNGPGAGMRSVLTARQALQEALAPCSEVGLIGTQALLSAEWARPGQCDLLCMPGGADLPYCKDLNGRGNQIIRRWVEEGGAYLGICAGAYYACSRCEFEPGTALEVVGNRQLALFPGLARGAVVSGFDYRSEAGAAAVPLRVRTLRGAEAKHTTAAVDCSSVGADSSICGSATRTASGLQPAAAAAATQAAGNTAEERRADGAVVANTQPAQAAGDTVEEQGADGAVVANTQPAQAATVAESADGVSMAASACGVDTSGWLPVLDYSNGGPMFCALNGDADLSRCGSGSGNTSSGVGAGGVGSDGSTGNRGGAEGRGGSGSDTSNSNSNSNKNSNRNRNSDSNSSGGIAEGRAVDVLAVYAGPPGSAAVGAAAAVRVAVGAGAAVLCGTHPELPADWLRAAEKPPTGDGLRAGAGTGNGLRAGTATGNGLCTGTATGNGCSKCSGSREGGSGAMAVGGSLAQLGAPAEGSGGVAMLGAAVQDSSGGDELAMHVHVNAVAQELEAADAGRRALWRLLLHAALCWGGTCL